MWEIYNNFVDLGLPSGTIWAKYNLGVDPNKLDSAKNWYGKLYAWGEIEPKDTYGWRVYKFGPETNLFKYNNKDRLTDLQLEDDAAYNINHHWRIPTNEQFHELLEYTINKWTENYKNIKGLNGRIFKSKINGE